MPPRIRPLTPVELSAPQSELYEAITSGPRARGPQHFALTAPDGSLRGPFDAMLRSPAIGAALQGLGAAIRYRSTLTDRARETAILLVAAHEDSAFERDAHEAIARSLAFSDADLAALRALDMSGVPRDVSMIASTTLALLAGDLDDEEWDAAHAALGDQTLFELITLVGYYATLALHLRVFRVTT
ncbi:carboxymuconolactone decarboxylase family protein [Microbacterium hominis]|uniref:Carboxymuconolactone decarboxylase family protein n=1 Tax=Microbacterium hominis TaxID=162426 RepID=A0A7D4PVV7_9MICO|nr:carboxymuconolactone decarboxylase family protein [Microbacterium hominis]QKJ20893.1 carboxymuconolactone decarboxylase family protein [Microbacterium hominis]